MGSNKINIGMLGGFLGGVAAIAAGLLAFVYVSTAEARMFAQQKVTNAALQQVLPPFDNVPSDETETFTSIDGLNVTFYVAKQQGHVVGYAGEVTTPKGFNKNITVMVGLQKDGSVRKVIVTASTETPGLGTVVTQRKRDQTIYDLFSKKVQDAGVAPNIYLDQYEQKKAGGKAWAVKKDGGEVDAKTGATITSRAVCGAVYAISKTCVEHQSELIAK